MLTPRQREVLRLIADGGDAPSIAAQLGLSVATVRNYMQAILERLDCRSQVHAVAVALRNGIIT